MTPSKCLRCHWEQKSATFLPQIEMFFWILTIGPLLSCSFSSSLLADLYFGVKLCESVTPLVLQSRHVGSVILDYTVSSKPRRIFQLTFKLSECHLYNLTPHKTKVWTSSIYAQTNVVYFPILRYIWYEFWHHVIPLLEKEWIRGFTVNVQVLTQ